MSSVLILFLVANSHCAQVPLMKTDTYYKRDMMLQVNGVTGQGALVVNRAPSYKISITSTEDMDLLQISSCSRDIDVGGAIKSDSIFGSWLKTKRTFDFIYEPNRVEQESGCVLKLGGYNKAEGQHSWAFIDFLDPKFTLPGGLSCNGNADLLVDGVSVCQTLQRLITQIWFAKPVALSKKVLQRCALDEPLDKKHWEFKMKPRECIYDFMELEKPYRRHRLTTMGYEEVPIRSNP